MTKLLQTTRDLLRYPSLSVLARDERVVRAGRLLVGYYYYVLPYAALLFLTSNALSGENFEPFWPIAWTAWIGFGFAETALTIKLFFCLAAVAAVFWHERRLARVLVFVALWQVHALESSFGYINHQWYGWLYSSLFFVFLPDLWRATSFERARLFLFLVWSAQASVALVYSIAGFHKVRTALEQFLAGEVHGFSPLAFSYLVADWVPKLQHQALLAPYIIDYPYLFWLPFALVPFFQLFSLWVMMRTRLQRLWAAGLLLMYFGIGLTMGISFHPLVLVIIVLFFASPFSEPYRSWREFVGDLPVVGQVYEYFLVRRRKSA
jgi:hypothetical protein